MTIKKQSLGIKRMILDGNLNLYKQMYTSRNRNISNIFFIFKIYLEYTNAIITKIWTF